MGSATTALARLRAPEGQALRHLARLVVDQATATPMREVATPQELARQVHTALRVGTRGDAAKTLAKRVVDALRDRWAAEKSPLKDFVPNEALDPLRSVLRKEVTLDERFVLRIIDHDAVHQLLKALLTSGIGRMGARMKEADKQLFGGIGQRAARRGKGLFGNLGGLAENLVDAVREEIDHAVEGSVQDMAREAITDAMVLVARYVANPANGQLFGEFRVAVLNVILDTPVADLVKEIDKARPEEVVEVVIKALANAASHDDFVVRLESAITKVYDEAGDRSLSDILTELGLLDVWRDATTDLVVRRLEALVATAEFEGWFTELLSDE